MPINFPNSPSPNQLYTYDDKTWEWNGVYWEVYSALTSYVTSTTFNYYTGTTQPLILNAVTGGSYSSGTLYLINNSGSVIPISGFSTSGGSSTVSGDYLPLSGGTVTGGTIFTSGLTANTISATTYLGNIITGATSVGSGTSIYDSTTDKVINIKSITSDTTNKVSVTSQNQTIELGVNEQNLTLWNLVVQGNKLLNGSVSYVSGLTFSVSPLEYLINGVIYNITGQTIVTLTSGDSTFDRIDVIFADISGNTGVLKGIPSDNPEKPLVDGDTQVEVTFVLVGANSTSANISNFIIYNENSGPPTEWRFSTGGTQSNRIIGNFTGTTYSGGTSIRVSGITGTTYTTFFTLSGITQLNTNNYPSLQFAIRNLSANTTTSQIRFRFLTSTGAQNGSTVFMNGAGTTNFIQYSPTNVSTWQLISIPIWRFYLTNTNVQVLEVAFNPGTGTQSRYLFDTFEFVSGLPTTPPANAWTAIQTETTGSTVTPPSPNATLTMTGGTNIQVQAPSGSTSLVVIDTRPNIRLSGLSATTISATTYQNLPISGLTAGQNINISGTSGNLTISFTGTTVSNFTGGTVSGATNFTNGLTANTISATTYLNLPTDIRVTGGTYSNGNTTFTNNTGGTFTVTGSATYSSGILSGSSNWVSNGNGSVTLPTVLVALYNNSNFIEPLQVYTISSGITGSGGIAALTDNDTNYIYVEYNNGSPRWGVSTDNSTINDSDINLCYIIYRLGNFVHVLDFGNEGAGLPNQISNRIIAIDRFGRESGFELGLSGVTGIVTLTAGVAWNGTNRQSLVAVNSQDDIFFKNFHSGGTWTYTTTGDTINNTYYDDGTDIVLATASKYLVNWYFRGQEVNDHLYEVYGTNEYDSVAEAQLSVEPALPELITSHAFLTGRIIVQVGATTGLVESAFVQVFQSTQVTQHNDLINIQGGTAGQYYHLTASQYSNNAYTNVDNNFSVGQTISGGLTADTVSATTYQNLPISGLTEGSNISITGSNGNFTVSFTGTTGTNFTGGTVSGATIFTNGLTANTISATTYSGDGSGLTNVQNIYNSDGTISSDRYVNISASTLWFSGLTKGFQVRISDFGAKPGFIFTSDSLESPSFSLYETGDILIEGPTEFANTAQFDSTVSMINLSPDITSPYLLGLGNSSEVTTFDSSLLLNSITGGSYSNTTLYLITNKGITIPISGFTKSGGTIVFTGGTVTGETNFTGGLTANTISATTYENLPRSITSVTESANVITVVNSNNQSQTYTIDAVTGGTYAAGQITLSGTGTANGTQISTKILPVALTVVSNTASTDASLSSTFTLTLTGNTTLLAPTNGFAGQRILYQLKQDGSGSKTLTLGSGFRTGPITVTLSTAANTTDYLGVIYNAVDNRWDVLALNKGYS